MTNSEPALMSSPSSQIGTTEGEKRGKEVHDGASPASVITYMSPFVCVADSRVLSRTHGETTALGLGKWA